LILNDICDLRQDRVERPERPLPARLISLRKAVLAGGVFLVAGLGLAGFGGGTVMLCNAALLVAAITVYDAACKRYAIAGDLAMGVCRGLSFLLAVAPAQWFSTIGVVALFVVGHFAAVTAVARRENEILQHGWPAWGPAAAVLAVGAAGFLLPVAPRQLPLAWFAAVLLATSLYAAVYVGWRLTRTRVSPNLTRQAIGLFIRHWTGVQAAVLVVCGVTAWLGAVILLGRPVAGWLGKRFPAS
jgi:4-hydroxybenzoate polyprenyltransferase